MYKGDLIPDFSRFELSKDRQNAINRIYPKVGLETKLQIYCASFLFHQYPLLTWVHLPAEKKRNWFEGTLMQLTGVRKGFPDFMILQPNNEYFGLAIELKVKYENGKKNTLDPAQKIWLDRLTKIGYKVEVVYSYDRFESIVNNYLAGVKEIGII